MSLTLVMIRCPNNATPERREIHGGDFSIGRGESNSWVIPDPERRLSKMHCRVVYNDGEWELHDHSTNGTYLNSEQDPIGRGRSQRLAHGHRIRFGLYEIEVLIDQTAACDRVDSLPSHQQSDFLRDPAPARSNRSFGDVALPASASALDRPNSLILPADFDPLAPMPEPFHGPTEPDHAPALQGAFRPPPVAIIPDDWDVDFPDAARPQAPRPAESPPQALEAQQERPLEQRTAPPPSDLRASPAASEADLLAAFLRGAGLNTITLQHPEKLFERLGAATRATVRGLRQTLMARASIKDEFRIAQTVIRATGNNPLKFSLDDDDALATLLGTGRGGSMPPEEAVAEAFADLRLHELATVSAMQAAVRVLLEQFSPEAIERKSAGTSALPIPAQKKARAWDTFVSHHKTVTQALADDFDSVFGKAFARAYEQAIEELTIDRKTS